jgi:tetratricopeptide (TPR) repeat protein
MLQRGGELLASGDFADARLHFYRVVGFDDPVITAAALLGLGEAHYRLDDEAQAVASWSAVLELPETPSTYPAWRNIAAARVRDGDLNGAITAYREADRRAPEEDKAEIAGRLGWLNKETGNTRASQRYFARSRGDGPRITLTLVIIALTSILADRALRRGRPGVLRAAPAGQAGPRNGGVLAAVERHLLHGDLLHLAFNMYALYLAGTIVERWYGSLRFLPSTWLRRRSSTASFVFGGNTRRSGSGASSACSASCSPRADPPPRRSPAAAS